jgi:hypothetical protein
MMCDRIISRKRDIIILCAYFANVILLWSTGTIQDRLSKDFTSLTNKDVKVRRVTQIQLWLSYFQVVQMINSTSKRLYHPLTQLFLLISLNWFWLWLGFGSKILARWHRYNHSVQNMSWSIDILLHYFILFYILLHSSIQIWHARLRRIKRIPERYHLSRLSDYWCSYGDIGG